MDETGHPPTTLHFNRTSPSQVTVELNETPVYRLSRERWHDGQLLWLAYRIWHGSLLDDRTTALRCRRLSRLQELLRTIPVPVEPEPHETNHVKWGLLTEDVIGPEQAEAEIPVRFGDEWVYGSTIPDPHKKLDVPVDPYKWGSLAYRSNR